MFELPIMGVRVVPFHRVGAFIQTRCFCLLDVAGVVRSWSFSSSLMVNLLTVFLTIEKLL
ncbi:hypothetical protein TBK1r_53270 [Stieleria magnilauensis]|uniref:Uncharacterized protein n=1 Tax=Stieleria magnilauensis TaxID=2527963 RepID=A0ABX5XWA4_9BACT|nr:hypothetical protein TBK1r_53270 [Planctomycetes bacterium TBK1r]